jgi:hypothetical protein
MGLGTPSTVSLADASEKAPSARWKIAQGLTPSMSGNARAASGETADQVREVLSAILQNEKHKAQWKSTLATLGAPLSNEPVDSVTTNDVWRSSTDFDNKGQNRPTSARAYRIRCWARPRPRACEEGEFDLKHVFRNRPARSPHVEIPGRYWHC